MSEETLDKIVSLAKRRGFVYPGSEIYGGLANIKMAERVFSEIEMRYA